VLLEKLVVLIGELLVIVRKLFKGTVKILMMTLEFGELVLKGLLHIDARLLGY
jgi:hypothetical protein